VRAAPTVTSVRASDAPRAGHDVRPRPLVEADLDRVAAIERAAFSDPWPRRSFEELLAQQHVRALALGADPGRLSGYALFSLVAGEGEILNFAVDPAVRRRGLGRRLLDAVLDAMRSAGTTAVFLEVRQSNDAAQRLYAGVGFRAVALRRGYYRNPTEHAVTMTLQLGPNAAGKR
jgi:ribosomal-protein-alanine N-acetyltransferase